MGALRAIWSGHKHCLDRMSLGELTVAYFQYPAIQAYLVLMGIGTVITVRVGDVSSGERALSLGCAVLAGVMVYPLVWYLLHRFVLHGRLLYRWARTASRCLVHHAAYYRRRHFACRRSDRRKFGCCGGHGGSAGQHAFL